MRSNATSTKRSDPMASDSNVTTADGVVEDHGDGRYTLRFERLLRHPIERVWAALTEPEELKGWLAEAEIELVEGGSISLTWQNVITPEQVEKYDIKGFEDKGPEERTPVTGKITRLEPPRLLEYETDTFGLMRWELREHADGCMLWFSSTLEAPEGMLSQMLAGWHQHLDGLDDALAGHPVDWTDTDSGAQSMDRWADLREQYTARLG
jgi:uncharacterized protein YndB with AHSA1/START domain